MLSAQKPISTFFYEGSTHNKSKVYAQVTMFFVFLLFSYLLIKAPLEIMPTLSKNIEEQRIPLVEELEILKKPDKDKKFEAILTHNSSFLYAIQIIKPEPVIEPEPPKPITVRVVRKTPVKKPIPQPKIIQPRHEPTPPPPADAAPAATGTQNVAAVKGTSNSEHATANKPGASGNQLAAELLSAANKHKTYPRMAQRRGVQGTNYMLVTINPNGTVASASLSKGSGDSSLDDATKTLSQKIKSLKFSAPNKTMRITVPIAYTMKK